MEWEEEKKAVKQKILFPDCLRFLASAMNCVHMFHMKTLQPSCNREGKGSRMAEIYFQCSDIALLGKTNKQQQQQTFLTMTPVSLHHVKLNPESWGIIQSHEYTNFFPTFGQG